nr:hypothetical protein [Candidatus Sigynarchaeum springense]
MYPRVKGKSRDQPIERPDKVHANDNHAKKNALAASRRGPGSADH